MALKLINQDHFKDSILSALSSYLWSGNICFSDWLNHLQETVAPFVIIIIFI